MGSGDRGFITPIKRGNLILNRINQKLSQLVVMFSTLNSETGWGMDHPKTPNPNCRLYWCLIEFIDW